jgi:DNA-directed RNA polymerase subunit M/transcription elongation factor TFIIS
MSALFTEAECAECGGVVEYHDAVADGFSRYDCTGTCGHSSMVKVAEGGNLSIKTTAPPKKTDEAKKDEPTAEDAIAKETKESKEPKETKSGSHSHSRY